jgi:uncharacterized membrane protein
MKPDRQRWDDVEVEKIVGNLLRGGVLLSAAVILVGAALYLWRHGREGVDYSQFHTLAKEVRGPIGIIKSAWHFRGQGLIQLGLLILIATPVARVAFSVYAFAREGDRTYVVITLIVLAVLLLSLFGRHLT